MISFSHRRWAVVALGATLLLAGACNNSDDSSGAAGAPASAAADNTAEICKSSGAAARTAVIGLLGKIAVIAKGNDAPTDAEMTELYRSTFGSLRDNLTGSSTEATDPEFATVLKDIAAEADKLATASDPASLGTEGFTAALEKLDTHCPSASPSASSAPGGAVGAAGAVGAKGSGCELPVTFSVADRWKAKAVEIDEDDPLAELARKGPLRMACEISGREAGVTAFVRVWIGPKGTGARKALKAIMTGEKTRKVTFTPGRIGGRNGVELRYQAFNNLLEEWSDRQALAVPTPKGAAVVELSGLGSAEPDGKAAYDLAKNSLTVPS